MRGAAAHARLLFAAACALLHGGCARLPDLSAQAIDDAERRWAEHGSLSYSMVLEFAGDRMETSLYRVAVSGGSVDTLLRDGVPASSESRSEYSVRGLFGVLRRELAMAERPALLGAPAGYRVYLRARFEPITGRLDRYDRSVGGASNRITIRVLEFSPR
jgi:hypothetical protein